MVIAVKFKGICGQQLAVEKVLLARSGAGYLYRRGRGYVYLGPNSRDLSDDGVDQFSCGVLWSKLFSAQIPSYIAGLVGGVVAIPVWEILEKFKPTPEKK